MEKNTEVRMYFLRTEKNKITKIKQQKKQFHYWQ